MDGNGRWAEARGEPVAAGHREGTRALRRTVEASIDQGVRSLAVYAFSTENWARPADEVETLMEILSETIDRELPDLAKQGVRTRFIGRRDRVPAWLRREDGRAGAGDREISTPSTCGSPSTTAAVPSWSTPRAGWSPTGSRRTPSTRTRSRRGSTRPSSVTSTC